MHRWQLEEINGVVPEPAPFVRESIEQWVSFRATGRSRNYGRILRAFQSRILPALGARQVNSLSPVDAMAYIQMRSKAGMKPSTINLDVSMLHDFCGWCVERGWAPKNIITRRMFLPVPRKVPRVLTDDEETRLLSAALSVHERAYGFVLLLLETGFRTHLGCHVRWEHVDLDRGMWNIPSALLKSRREYRQPIALRLLGWLRAHVRASGMIFGPGARKWWYTLRARAGLPDLKRHDLRRNFVTRCRRAGVPVEIAAALSDHTDVRTMMGVYRCVDETDARDALSRIDAQRKIVRQLQEAPCD